MVFGAIDKREKNGYIWLVGGQNIIQHHPPNH